MRGVLAAEERFTAGAGEAGSDDEKIEWKTEKGNRMSQNQRRLVVKVPRSFGQLVQTAGAGSGVMLFFQNAEGEIRNVVLNDAKALYRIEME